MKLKIYATKDVVVGEFLTPIYLHNDKEAIRVFENSMREFEKTEEAYKLKDLQMYCLGEYNTETGEIKSDVYFLTSAVNTSLKEEKEGE